MGIWIWFFINVPIVTYINGTGVISNNLFPGVYYAVASGFVHALYFATLSLSYAIGDVSVVYPISRGAAVAMAALVETFILSQYFASVKISFVGWLGIAGVVCGVVLIGLQFTNYALTWRGGKLRLEKPSYTAMKTQQGPSDDLERDVDLVELSSASSDSDNAANSTPQSDELSLGGSKEINDSEQRRRTSVPVETSVDLDSHAPPLPTVEPAGQVETPKGLRLQIILYSLLVGALIAVYTVIDYLCVGIHKDWDSLTYLCVAYGACNLFCTPIILWKCQNDLIYAWKEYKKYIVMIGLASPGTHLMVLYALSLGSMSYIVALREVAIVLAAILGFVFLNEDVLVQKVVGIVILVASIIVIKVA